jgi:putative Mg2+ transporter-C (MgtC) family protein
MVLGLELTDWRSELTLVVRVGLAALLGALVGWEREIHDSPAGLRTYMMVTMGSALFALVSLHAGPNAPTQLAAAIPTGIGFLGAGMILRGDKGISGLTTAASVWGMAAVGLAIGYGMHLIAILSALLILGVFLLRYWTKSLMHAGHACREPE